MLRAVVLIALGISSAAACAQVYECTDAKGVKQYTQFCPPGTVQQREVLKPGEDLGAGSTAPKSGASPEVDFRKRLLERQEAETKAGKENADAAEAAENCAGARGQLKALEDGQRLSVTDPDTGERTIMGDEERAAQTEQARKAVETWCKK